MVGKLSPGQNGKVFVQAFFRKLAGRGVPVAHELAPTEPAGETAGAAPPFVQRCAPQNAQQMQKREANKIPCRPKTAKRIFGGPVSHGPSGQAKERTRILPVRRDSFCPACRAIWRAGRSCAASRCCGGLCARCPGVFSAGASLSCSWPAGCLLLLRLVWPALPGPACWKCARVLPCAAFFVYLLPFPA